MVLHWGAARKGHKSLDRLVNIDYIERRALERKAKPVTMPKVPDVEKLKAAAKRMADMKNALLKKAAPKPVPKLDVKRDLVNPLDPAKIQLELKKQLDLKTEQLKNGKSFMDKPGQLPAGAKKEIKMAATASAIRMGAKPGDLPGAGGGPSLKSRSGFTMADKAMPMGIGGGDMGLKMAGGPAIVVHTGVRAKADASVLSPVAMDRGALQNKGGGSGTGKGVGGFSGLVLGSGGGGKGIAVPGRSAGPAVPLPPSTTSGSGRRFSDAPAESSGGGVALSGPRTAALPNVSAIARRPARAARPLFQISGPLANRPVLFKQIPEYPAWAEAKGIQAAVTLQFTVSPEGNVRSNIMVARTSGFTSLDQLAVDALRQWRFQPLPEDQMRDELGAITFTFAVR
jgi:TonB family protein